MYVADIPFTLNQIANYAFSCQGNENLVQKEQVT